MILVSYLFIARAMILFFLLSNETAHSLFTLLNAVTYCAWVEFLLGGDLNFLKGNWNLPSAITKSEEYITIFANKLTSNDTI